MSKVNFNLLFLSVLENSEIVGWLWMNDNCLSNSTTYFYNRNIFSTHKWKIRETFQKEYHHPLTAIGELWIKTMGILKAITWIRMNVVFSSLGDILPVSWGCTRAISRTPFDRVLWNNRWKIHFPKRKRQHLEGKEYHAATSRALLETKECKIAFPEWKSNMLFNNFSKRKLKQRKGWNYNQVGPTAGLGRVYLFRGFSGPASCSVFAEVHSQMFHEGGGNIYIH